jgi:hypothetical protein
MSQYSRGAKRRQQPTMSNGESDSKSGTEWTPEKVKEANKVWGDLSNKGESGCGSNSWRPATGGGGGWTPENVREAEAVWGSLSDSSQSGWTKRGR